MMNVLALSLVLTSIVSAGFFTPSPEKQQQQLKDVDGVVIELEKEDGNTKVLISPQDQTQQEKGYVTNAKEKLSETMEKIVGKEEEEENDHHKTFSPRELVCDAYGKCKHKIASAMGKTKDVASDKATEAASDIKQGSEQKVYEAKEEAKKAMGETVTDVTQGSKEKLKRHVSSVREEAKKAKRWMGTITGVVHLVGLATAYGMCVWITFGSNYVLAGALSKQQFGMVQSKIYPVYFKAMAFSVGMGLVGHLMSGKRMVSPLSMAAALGMVLVNLLYLEPRATKVMFERMKKEKEEGKEASGIVEATATATPTEEKKKSRGWREIVVGLGGRLNSYSSVLNVLTLMSLSWHLLHLAHHLHTCC